MSNGQVNVVLGSDHTYAPQLATALRSLSHSADGTEYQPFVLHSGFEPDLRHRIEASCGPSLGVRWVSVPGDRLRHLRHGQRLPESSAYRLLVPELLPVEVSRVIYLDSDVLVRTSLADLWTAELGDHFLGAVRDAYHPVSSFELPWRELGVDPKTAFFNAGVMVMALDRMRAADIAGQAMELLRGTALSNTDQTALNAIIKRDWQAVSPTWNVQTHHLSGDHGRAWAYEDLDVLERAIGDPSIVHFCHGDFARPWEAGSSHPYRDDWFEMLDRTEWAGWRPRRRWSAGAVRRIRRAGRDLLKPTNA